MSAGAIRVFEATLRVLERGGPSALTMDNVAAEAGVTATAIYRHFANKEELQKSLIRDRYNLFLEYLTAADQAGSARATLISTFDRFLDFSIEHPHAYELLFVTPHGISIDR